MSQCITRPLFDSNDKRVACRRGRCLPCRIQPATSPTPRLDQPPAGKTLSISILTDAIHLRKRPEEFTRDALSSRQVHVPYGIPHLTNVNNCDEQVAVCSNAGILPVALVSFDGLHVKYSVQSEGRMRRLDNPLLKRSRCLFAALFALIANDPRLRFSHGHYRLSGRASADLSLQRGELLK